MKNNLDTDKEHTDTALRIINKCEWFILMAEVDGVHQMLTKSTCVEDLLLSNALLQKRISKILDAAENDFEMRHFDA